MKRKIFIGLTTGLLLIGMLGMAEAEKDILISRASSQNDAQYVNSSNGTQTVKGTDPFDAGGWSVYPVYFPDGSYDTGFNYNASLIEINLSDIPSTAIINSAILHINVAKVIQRYDYDAKLAILSHLRSKYYTGNAESDYWHIDGPPPDMDTLCYFYSGSSTGWKQIDVTNDIKSDIKEGVKWATFWISPAPWETPTQIAWEAKGISIAGADYNDGTLTPYLEIHNLSSLPPAPSAPKPAIQHMPEPAILLLLGSSS